MKTIKYRSFILAIAGMGFLLQNCGKHKCDNDTVTDYSISSKDRSKVPYTGFETLTFVRTTVGDTHTFIANGWKDDWGLTSTTDDCPQKERYERQQLIFTSPTFSKSITISVYRHNVNKSTYLDIDFQNTLYDLAGISGLGRQINTVTVLSHEYANIDSFSNNNVNPFPTDYMCYYNTTEGIIRMRLTSGEIWELLNQ